MNRAFMNLRNKMVLFLILALWSPLMAQSNDFISMAGPDGQGLIMEKLKISLAAHGPLSLTEMDIHFRNPQNRQIEGKFKATLPVGATISRFAKEVNGKLMEGEIVERKKAARIYTEILHTMRDPALLQQDQGNIFKAKIFPIPANGTTRIVLSYSQVTKAGADGLRRLEVPLKGLPKIKEFEFLALCRPLAGEKFIIEDDSGKKIKAKRKSKNNDSVSGKDVIVFADEMSETNFQPVSDRHLVFKPQKSKVATFLKAGNFQMISITPKVPVPKAVKGKRNWLFYIDTSASMADRADVKLKALSTVIGEFSKGDTITFKAFDLDVNLLGTRVVKNKNSVNALIKKVSQRKCLGGTDFVKLMKVISKDAKVKQQSTDFVIVTDGVATFGSKEIQKIIKSLDFPACHKLSVLVIGSTEDDKLTAALTEEGGGRVVRLPLSSNWKDDAIKAARELNEPCGVTVTLYDEKAKWIEPSEFRDVRPGMELIAFSALSKNQKSMAGMSWENRKTGKIIDVSLEGKIEVVPDFAPLLERESWHSRLNYLEKLKNKTSDSKKRIRLDNEMIQISTDHRVLCSLTSLLVLETEDDYIKYGIARKGLSDILVVGDKGVELKKRVVSDAIVRKLAKKKEEEKRQKELSEKREAEQKSMISKAKKMVSYAVDSIGDAFSGGGERMESAPPVNAMEPVLAEASVTGETSGAGSSGRDNRSSFRTLSPQRQSVPRPTAARPSVRRPASVRSDARRPDMTVQSSGSVNHFSDGGGADLDEGSSDEADSDDSRSIGNGSDSSADSDDEFSNDEPREDLSPEVQRTVQGSLNDKKALKAPSWINDAHYTPSKKTLTELSKEVEKSKKDRRKRNAYCWALAKAQNYKKLLEQTLDWQKYDYTNPMLYEFAGIAFDGLDDSKNATRAYASIGEVSPGSSGLLNRGGYLLMRQKMYKTAETLFRFAMERRPDHHNNYRGLAMSLWYQGRFDEAVETLIEVISKSQNSRYKNVKRVFREELGYVLRAWAKSEPSDRSKIKKIARKNHIALKRVDALRITLHWETDANDVDLHVVDPNNEECFYSHKVNKSGLNLYEDLTQGLGPEVAVVPPGRFLDGAYHVGVKYFSAGPMGVSRGIVLIQKEDKSGKPHLQIEPFTLLPAVDGNSKDMRHIAVVE